MWQWIKDALGSLFEDGDHPVDLRKIEEEIKDEVEVRGSLARFRSAVAEILRWEGGYVDHPQDPGGATNMGITLATLQDWRGRKVTKEDVKNLTQSEAEEIYLNKYWRATKCHQLPAGIALLVFDSAVNQGPGRAARFLQEALNVRVDGRIGPVTLAALQATDRFTLMRDFTVLRMRHYASLSTFSVFGKGWTKRLLHTYQEATLEAAYDV